MRGIQTVVLLVSVLGATSALSNESTKAAEIEAYEQCVVRVFTQSDKLSDVYAECEAEMDAFVALHDEKMQEKIRHRTMAETQRELRARKKAEKNKKSKDGE